MTFIYCIRVTAVPPSPNNSNLVLGGIHGYRGRRGYVTWVPEFTEMTVFTEYNKALSVCKRWDKDCSRPGDYRNGAKFEIVELCLDENKIVWTS